MDGGRGLHKGVEVDQLFAIKLISAGVVAPSVIAFANQLKVAEIVVFAVAVQVVNVIIRRYDSAMESPYVAMKQAAATISATIIASIPQRIFISIEHHKRQRSRFRAKRESSALEHFMNGLPCNAERLANISKAKSRLVKLIHFICFGILRHYIPPCFS